MQAVLDALLANALVAFGLALLAALVARWGRRPALAHVLWIIVLLKLVTPPLFSLQWPLSRAAVDESAAAPTVPVAAEDPLPEGPVDAASLRLLIDKLTALRAERDARLASAGAAQPLAAWTDAMTWVTLCGWVWLGGSIAWCGLCTWRVARFQRLLSLGWPATVELQNKAEELAKRLGLRRCPLVWIVPGRVSPLLWMLGGRGRLVLPAELLIKLNPAQKEALLTHEMAHARRCDHWVRWLELAALAVHWWNPVAWWSRRELQQAEEECCDAWVVWLLPDSARAYAKALLQTVTFLDARPALPPVASGAAHVTLLKRRLAMIVNEPLHPRLSKPVLCSALLFGLLVLPFAPARVIARAADEEQSGQTQRQSNQSVEQRIQSLENKLDKVLKALETRDSAPAPKKAEADTRREEKSIGDIKRLIDVEVKQAREAAEKAIKQAEEGRRIAEQQREKAMRLAEFARERGQRDVDNVRQQAENALKKARIAVATKKEEDAKQDSKKGESHERKIVIDAPGLDAKAKADLEKKLAESLDQLGKLGELKDLQKIIMDVSGPEALKKMQIQVQDNVKKGLDVQKLELDRAIGEMKKSMENVIIQKKAAGEDAKRAEAKATPRAAARVETRDTEMRDVQRRLDRLEQRLDKVLTTLEKSQNSKEKK
jgi:bla regulator protein blaR1